MPISKGGKMMRVLQINSVYGIGSTGVIVKDIHEMCLSEGIESFVAYSSSNVPKNEIKNGYKIGRSFGKKLHAFLSRISGMQGYFSRFSTKKLLSYIKKIKPDIVQLHNLHSNYINLNMLLKFLAKNDIKTIVTHHDCWFYTGRCFHYTAVGCNKWLESCGSCPKKNSNTPPFVFDRSAKVLRDRKKYFALIKDLTVVGVSQWITNESVKTVFKGRKAVTIHNGIDTKFFKPTPSNLREKYGLNDKFIILGPALKWLSKVNETVFREFISSLKDDEVLMLLGCNEQQIKNLPKNVLGVPFIKDKDELRKIYTLADVFINPTREESLSLINVEAQSCGTPVITFDNTGVKETVDGISGFAVETGNVSQLIMKKEIVKSGLNEDCKKYVLEKFDVTVNYRKYIQLFNEI